MNLLIAVLKISIQYGNVFSKGGCVQGKYNHIPFTGNDFPGYTFLPRHWYTLPHYPRCIPGLGWAYEK